MQISACKGSWGSFFFLPDSFADAVLDVFSQMNQMEQEKWSESAGNAGCFLVGISIICPITTNRKLHKDRNRLQAFQMFTISELVVCSIPGVPLLVLEDQGLEGFHQLHCEC